MRGPHPFVCSSKRLKSPSISRHMPAKCRSFRSGGRICIREANTVTTLRQQVTSIWLLADVAILVSVQEVVKSKAR